jgi:hypothetical protein
VPSTPGRRDDELQKKYRKIPGTSPDMPRCQKISREFWLWEEGRFVKGKICLPASQVHRKRRMRGTASVPVKPGAVCFGKNTTLPISSIDFPKRVAYTTTRKSEFHKADSLSVITEAEWGEIPHEWVTVMPP